MGLLQQLAQLGAAFGPGLGQLGIELGQILGGGMGAAAVELLGEGLTALVELA